MVEGTPTQIDLGVLPTLWSASGALFLGGCIVFGIATMRARVLSRAAAAVFAFGFIASAPISIGLDSPRLTAVPIGIGLAWLGYALWSQSRTPAASLQATAIDAASSRRRLPRRPLSPRADHRQGDRHERHTHAWNDRRPERRVEEARARRGRPVPDDLHLLDPSRLPVWPRAHRSGLHPQCWRRLARCSWARSSTSSPPSPASGRPSRCTR